MHFKMVPEFYHTPQSQGVHYKRWIPTIATGILRRLLYHRPNSSLLFADFDWLPPPNITQRSKKHATAAIGEPLITDMSGINHECLLSALAHCDILFPTDFDSLAALLHSLIKSESSSCHDTSTIQVMKQSSFLREYGPEILNSTRSWTGYYSPLTGDFTNCSVLMQTMS